MAEAPEDTAPSVLQNKPDPDFDPNVKPEPLEGEVQAGASHPDQEEAPSVAANKPEELEVTEPEPLEGEVPAGASRPDELPPSVVGTSQDPNREE